MGVWKDPFSLAAATARQSRYAKAHAEKGKWTPQFRVDGKTLKGKGLGQLIQTAVAEGMGATPTLKLGATATWTPADGDTPAQVSAAITLTTVAAGAKIPDGLHLLPLLVQKKAVTNVPVGENRGKTLNDFFIVRVIGKAVTPAAAQATGGATATLAVPAGVTRDNLHVVVLCENPTTMRTIETAVAELPAPKK